jgi:hypothetical protein
MKRSWPNLRYYPVIYMEGLNGPRKTKDSRSPGRDLNMGPPEYEALHHYHRCVEMELTLNSTTAFYNSHGMRNFSPAVCPFLDV